MRKRTGENRVCPICKSTFYVYPSLIKERIYCSRTCHIAGLKQKLNPIYYNRQFRKGEYKICGFCKQPYYCQKYRLEKSLFCSRRCLGKARIGKKAGNWKNGITPKNLLIRTSEKYDIWRKKVFERDNYTCQKCEQKGGTLHAHHIKPFAKFPKLRFVVSNGITLCKKCHNEIKL